MLRDSLVSFIIPAHNEEALIGQCVDAIHRCVGSQPYEIIVAADACTDRTGEIALQHGASVVQINHRQIAAARNAGAAAARGDVLIFVDGDTLVTSQAIRGALQVLRSGAVGGGSLARFDGPVPMYGIILIRLILPILQPIIGLAGGCFIFCTRAAYLEAGGFSEKFYCAEEVAFGAALKRQGRFVILRSHVTTSGRKIRSHTLWQMLSVALRLAWEGEPSMQRREGLEFWYGPR